VALAHESKESAPGWRLCHLSGGAFLSVERGWRLCQMRDRPGGPPGLHNFAAYTGGRVPPELEGLPSTTSYVVDLWRCTEEQKQQFFAALGRNPGHPEANIPSQYL
jgi:hypothetical protein